MTEEDSRDSATALVRDTGAVTTAPSPRLGRGVRQLIPQSPAATPADQATAALAALRTVPVHIGVLQAAVVLLENAERETADEGIRTAVQETVGLLHEAMSREEA